MSGRKVILCRCKSWAFSFVLLFAVLGMTSSASLARELAVLSDKSAKLTSTQSGCRPTSTFRVEAGSAMFFENRLQDLGGLFSVALNKTYAQCPGLRDVRMDGYVGSVKIISGTARSQDGWRLVLGTPALNKVAADIPKTVNRLDKLPRLLELFKPFQKVPGIVETSGYRQFAQTSRAVVTELAFGRGNEFDAYVQQKLETGSRKSAEAQIDKILGVVAAYNQRGADGLKQRFGQIADRLATAELAQMLEAVLVSEVAIDQAVNDVSSQIKRQQPAATLVQDTDRLVSEWVDARLADHQSRHPDDYLDDLQAHVALKQSLAGIKPDQVLPQTNAVLDAARSNLSDFMTIALQQRVAEAKELISASGSSYLDVDVVIETGLSLHREFADFGFAKEGQALAEFAALHAEALVANGLAGYRASLVVLEMDRSTVSTLRADAEIFDDLAADFEQFQSYADVTRGAIDVGKQRHCQSVAQGLRTTRNAAKRISIGKTHLSLAQISCALYRNDHILTAFAVDRDGASGSIEIDVIDEGVVQFELAATSSHDVLAGTEPDWFPTIKNLVIPPPSGKPDAKGVTECDVLAGDPSDRNLTTRGVDFERVPADYDFDRALEACIAAVDHAPGETRQVYQLARTLDYLGDSETALHYIDVASAAQYGPALHLKAMNILTVRQDDDAFFDAIDLFKLAAARGYAPAKKELNQLIPPGTDIFRESPPPTDTQMIEAFGRKQCEGIRGFAQGCVYRKGVRSKSCFQTSETEFSCEVVFSQRCEFNTFDDPLMRLFTGMMNASCPTRSDPMFLKFTKRGTGWSARKEF